MSEATNTPYERDTITNMAMWSDSNMGTSPGMPTRTRRWSNTTLLLLIMCMNVWTVIMGGGTAIGGEAARPTIQDLPPATADGIDPITKFLLDDAVAQGRITKERHAALVRDFEEQAYLRQPTFKFGYDRGFTLSTNDNAFLLRIRGRLDAQYSFRSRNSAWENPGDAKNFPEIVGVFGDYRISRFDSESQSLSLRRARLYFMGHVFDPAMLKFYVQLRMDSSSDPSQTPGTVQLYDYFVTNSKINWAQVQFGQYRVYFNRSQINSTASMQFTDRALVQDAFPANGLDRRDIGLTIMNDDEIYPLNYMLGVFGGVGPNNTSLFAFDSEQVTAGCPGGQQPSPAPIPPGAASCSDATANQTGFNPLQRNLNADTHRNINRLMLSARLNWNILGRPGYGEGDISYSANPQFAVGGGYAYNPSINTSSNNSFIGVDLANLNIRRQLATIGSGRELGWGVVDFSTWAADSIFKYRGFSLQGEFYFREVKRHDQGQPCLQFQQTDPVTGVPTAGAPFSCTALTPDGPLTPVSIGNALGWYVQTGYYLIPRHLELAGRYGYWDPDTHVGGDLIKEVDLSLNWFINGTYDHSIQMTYSNIAMGTGGYAIGRSSPLPAVSSGSVQFPNGPVPVDGVGGTLVQNALTVQYQIFF